MALNYVFDPNRPYLVVIYLRMSTEKQNERSPDQQLEMIQRRLRKLGYRWKIIAIYRDDAISGRYLRKRPQFQRMLRDLKTRTVAANLILVDTKERFARAKEMDRICDDLYEHHGVLVLVADTDFMNPLTPQGQIVSAVENIRAREDSRIKAHNVLRGLWDKVRMKEWPGGPVPFGCMLESTQTRRSSSKIVVHSKLLQHKQTGWIIDALYKKAKETAWGRGLLTRWLDARSDIPQIYKPFHPDTVAYWLTNPIYYGELVWAEECTGIVNDTRVSLPNAEGDILRVPDFWAGIVSKELWLDVQAIGKVRSDRWWAARQNEGEKRLLSAPAPGMTLNYLLSGLLHCECGLRMTASSSATYVTKSGESRRYVSYVCPGYLAGSCSNGTRVPEEWVRTAVIGQLKERLFG